MHLFDDVRQAARRLRHSPAYAFTAILILGLGIGSVTVVFSVVNSVLLQPFDFQSPKRLVILREATRDLQEVEPVNYQHYLNWKQHSKTLSAAAIFMNREYSVTEGTHHPEIVKGLGISPNFFSVLGLQPALGRGFLAGEGAAGHNHVVLLSWSAWQQYFHGDPAAVGRTLQVNGEPNTVVGVLPRGFRFPHLNEMVTAVTGRTVQPYRVFQPLIPDPSIAGDHNYLVIARLEPGVTIAQAQNEIGGLQQDYAHTIGKGQVPSNAWVQIQPLLTAVTGRVSTGLWLALAAVGAVLLIGCLNLASLQLARAVAHEREMALRAALGASRRQLLWVVLRENVLLAMIGGGLGIAFSLLGVHMFVAFAPASLPRLSNVQLSWPVLLGAMALSVATSLLFGLLPALRSLRTTPQTALQSGSSRVANSREGQRTRNLLVAGEVACTLTLLMLSGLLLHSLATLLTQQRDFKAGHLTLVQVNLDSSHYSKDVARARFYSDAMDRLKQLPGVAGVAMTSDLPLTGNTWEDSLDRPDHPLSPGQAPTGDMRWVSPSYLSTLHIPLLKGRDLQPSDRNHATNVLISQQTARTVWPDEDALGRSFHAGGETYTVVGVVANARINNLKSTTNMVYIPYWDNPWWSGVFLVRSPLPASTLADSIRRAIWSVDPETAIPVLRSMNAQISGSVATEQFQTSLLTGFGGAALLLALIGIYGMLAYSISLRRQEFGIRLALGSGRHALTALVMRQAAWPILGGMTAGLAAGLLATRWMRSLLYHTPVNDPRVLTAAIVILAAAAFFAALIPALQAGSVDPIETLRAQ